MCSFKFCAIVLLSVTRIVCCSKESGRDSKLPWSRLTGRMPDQVPFHHVLIMYYFYLSSISHPSKPELYLYSMLSDVALSFHTTAQK